MPKTLLIFSRKGITDKDRENLVAQLEMVAEAMEVEVNVIDSHQKLNDTKQETISKAVFDLLGLREINPTILDEHRMNQDLHALRSQGLFDDTYCVVLTGKIDYISGHYEKGFVAHDNVCFLQNLEPETVMALVNEVFSNLEIG